MTYNFCVFPKERMYIVFYNTNLNSNRYQIPKPRFIATNHRVVAAKRQQRELVALTTRGSVLFYSSAI